MFKVLLVVIIGIAILATECIYFCNKIYVSEITDDNYIMKIISKPALRDKIVVGIFTMIIMVNIIILGWITYKEQQR